MGDETPEIGASEAPTTSTESAVSEAPTPSATEGPRSEDQLWDSIAEDEADTPVEATSDDTVVPAEPGQEKPLEEQVEAKAEETETEKEPDKPVVETPEPEHLKKAFELLKGYPKLREAIKLEHYQLEAYREQFPTARAAREFRDLIPTAEDAKVAVTKAVEFDNIQDGFANDPVGLIDGLASNEPQKFEKFVLSVPDALASRIDPNTGQRDPRLYIALSQRFFTQTLDNLRQQHAGDEVMLEALEMTETAAFGKREDREQRPLRRPENDPIAAENARLKAREAQRAQSEFETFRARRDEDFHKTLKARIEERLSGPMGVSTYTKGAQARIAEEIRAAVIDSMVANTLFNNELARRTATGKGDEAHRAALTKYMVDQALARLPLKAKEVLNKWKTEILGTNREDLRRREAIASRRDPGKGSASVARDTRAKPVADMTPAEKRAHYAKFPDDDSIFATLER